MSKDNVTSITSPADALTELLRNGAKQLIVEAVEAELEQFLEECSEILSNGKKRIVRNGYLRLFRILCCN